DRGRGLGAEARRRGGRGAALQLPAAGEAEQREGGRGGLQEDEQREDRREGQQQVSGRLEQGGEGGRERARDEGGRREAQERPEAVARQGLRRQRALRDPALPQALQRLERGRVFGEEGLRDAGE